MKNASFSIEELFRFLDAGVSAFHSTAAAAAILEAEGYVNCPESAAWELAPGGKYYTTRNGSAVLAWRMPKGELTGWHAAASHSDSPTWRIKQFDTEDKVFAKAEVEGYGGMIMPSWLDRPLTVAGRLLVRTENGIESRLVCPDRALACIPNLCIHFSRDLNNGMKYNPQVDLQPIFGGKGGNLKEVLAAEAGVKAEDLLDADLVLATREKAVRMGLNGEYFMSGRDDDVAQFVDRAARPVGGGDVVVDVVAFEGEHVGGSFHTAEALVQLGHGRIVHKADGDLRVDGLPLALEHEQGQVANGKGGEGFLAMSVGDEDFHGLSCLSRRALVGGHDGRHQRVAHDVFAGKIAERDVVDALEDGAHLHKAALPAGQIDLRDVAGDDDFRTEPQARQCHLHLLGRGGLGFVQDNEGVI